MSHAALAWGILVWGLPCLLLQGCFRLGIGTPKPPPDCGDGGLGSIVFWVSAICALAILAGIAAIVIVKQVRIGAGLIATGFLGIVSGQVILWIRNHPGIVVGLVAAGTLAAVALYLFASKKGRAWLERQTGKDLDRDGKVGEA